MKTLFLSLLAAAVLAPAAGAVVPESSFSGSSPLIRNADTLAFFMRRDPSNPKAGYAVLAEYTRTPKIPLPGPERLKIWSWVPRMYAYRVEETGDKTYVLKPLRVSVSGVIEVDGGYATLPTLTLAKKGTLDGAVLNRYEKGSILPAERITFDGTVGSTWEPWVSGNFFWSNDTTGGDYFRKDVNTTLADDHTADFYTQDVVGKFAGQEKAPGLWVFSPAGQVAKGLAKVDGRIGVFIDIVNWRPFFTTRELLLINPDDARDVGFFYQRH